MTILLLICFLFFIGSTFGWVLEVFYRRFWAIENANKLREAGINTEVYLNDKKLKAKFKYADKLKIPYVVVIGEDEINTNTVKVKNMNTGDETSVELDAKKICEII